ncbi:MAG: response regulator [Spirochaetales bacterium]
MNILLVEDEEINRRILAKILSRFHATVVQARDGQEALELLEGFAAEVIITDLNMPRMDGLSLIRELKARGNSAPVVVLSAHNESEILEKAKELGAVHFLFKPIRVELLTQTLETLAAE